MSIFKRKTERLAACPWQRFPRAMPGSSGLTLIEILIALFIFLLGILGVLSMFPVAARTAGKTTGEVRTNILAGSALAQISTDCTAIFAQGDIQNVTAGTLTASGTPNWDATDDGEWKGYFVTIIDTNDTHNPARWQARLITGNTNKVLSVCPDWSPLLDLAYSNQTFIITRLGLPSPPRAALSVLSSASTLVGKGVNWEDDQWNGYSIVIVPSPNTDLKGSTSVIQDTLNGDQLVLASALPETPKEDDVIAIINPNTRNAFVRDVDGGDNEIHVGQTNGATVDTLRWMDTGNDKYYSLDPTDSSEYDCAADGASDTMEVTDASAAWRGRLVRITGDPATTSRAGQVRIITDVNIDYSGTQDLLTVYPDWTQPPKSTDKYKVARHMGYYLIITRGRAAGRILRIQDHTGDAAGDKLDCGPVADVNWGDMGVFAANRNGQYDLQNATSFMVLGGESMISSLHPNPSANYRFNAFGWPKVAEPQADSDTYILNGDEELSSDYNVVAIFSDTGNLPNGPIRVDVFVFRGFNSSKDLPSNRNAAGFATGYIGRP